MSAEGKVSDSGFLDKVAGVAANYDSASRAYARLPKTWKDATGQLLPDSVRANLAEVKAGAAREFWEAISPALAQQFAVCRLRWVAARAVHPKAWPKLREAFRQRADRWADDSPSAARDRWLDRAALEALADVGPPPEAWAPEWYRKWSNRVGQILRRELISAAAPLFLPLEADLLGGPAGRATAARVVEAWRVPDPLAADLELLAYLEREELDEEERALVKMMRRTGPNVSQASAKLAWSYWRTRRVFQQVQAKGRAAMAGGL